MNLKTEIICKNFKHKKIIDNKIKVTEKSEEYYVIPLNKNFELVDDGEVYKLIFDNQLLWLKYSNSHKEILIKEFDFEDFIIINSKDIIDIYLNVNCTQCFRKGVWHTRNNVSVNKKYHDKYLLVIPIIDDMIDVKEFGEGIVNYQIRMFTNEILLKQAKKRSEKNNCYILLTNNVMLNKDALFVVLTDDDLSKFIC